MEAPIWLIAISIAVWTLLQCIDYGMRFAGHRAAQRRSKQLDSMQREALQYLMDQSRRAPDSMGPQREKPN